MIQKFIFKGGMFFCHCPYKYNTPCPVKIFCKENDIFISPQKTKLVVGATTRTYLVGSTAEQNLTACKICNECANKSPKFVARAAFTKKR